MKQMHSHIEKVSLFKLLTQIFMSANIFKYKIKTFHLWSQTFACIFLHKYIFY